MNRRAALVTRSSQACSLQATSEPRRATGTLTLSWAHRIVNGTVVTAAAQCPIKNNRDLVVDILEDVSRGLDDDHVRGRPRRVSWVIDGAADERRLGGRDDNRIDIECRPVGGAEMAPHGESASSPASSRRCAGLSRTATTGSAG